jgi:hypothetical protein
MSLLDANIAFTKRLNDVPGLSVPVKHENQPFDIPNGPYAAAFLRENDEGIPITLGPGGTVRNRYVGHYIIQIFISPDEGVGPAFTIADQIASYFKRVQFSSGTSGLITCHVPGARPLGKSPDGRYQVNVSIPYYRDEQ